MSAISIPGPEVRSASTGWTPHLIRTAPSGLLCSFWNEYNRDLWVGYADDLRPEYNVAYLWWKLTGIGREQDRALSGGAEVWREDGE